MKVVIEFYRIRPSDQACAVVGRETVEGSSTGTMRSPSRCISATR